MVIIFYDSESEKIYICTERDKMKTVAIGDPDILSHIPNDDILYVENAHYITKKQFGDWLQGDVDFSSAETDLHRHYGFLDEGPPNTTSEELKQAASKYANSMFVHPAHNGTILIEDIKTDRYPNGIQLNGKWDFLPVDAVGGFEILEESNHYNILLAKGKIEVVDFNYVKKNINKKKQVSRADAALDAILIKDDKRGAAEAVATSGGINPNSGSGSDPIEIFVEDRRN